MLTRSDILEQIDALTSQANRLRVLLADESSHPPAIVAARTSLTLEQLRAKLAKTAEAVADALKEP